MKATSTTIAGALVLAGAMLVTKSSIAQQEIGVIQHVERESPQHFALELRFSPYRPQIDEEPGLTGRPYEETFGSMKRLQFAVELDWQALRIPYVGSIGPGLSAGYTQMSDASFPLAGSVATGKETPRTGNEEETSLNVFPFYGVAVLRIDEPWRKAGFPLVPYAKAGLGYGIWRVTNPGGTTGAPAAGGGTVRGTGGTWGYHAALGVAFALDVLDRGAVKNLDTAVGINHTYVFAEYYWSVLNGIGQDHPLRIGTNTWSAGLSFEL